MNKLLLAVVVLLALAVGAAGAVVILAASEPAPAPAPIVDPYAADAAAKPIVDPFKTAPAPTGCSAGFEADASGLCVSTATLARRDDAEDRAHDEQLAQAIADELED